MGSTLTDLNDVLFSQLNRLNAAEDDETLETELKRSSEMAKIATQIIQNGNLMFKAMQHMDEFGYGLEGSSRMAPRMLEYREFKECSDTRRR